MMGLEEIYYLVNLVSNSPLTGFIVQGIFISIGSVIGNYIGNKGLISQMERAMKTMKENGKKKESGRY